MNEINKTLYIPLYGKALVSRRGIILRDKKAEEIWDKEGFKLSGKAKSKWLALYMGMRAAVFDRWLREKMVHNPGAVVLHIGCGMDSRISRVGNGGHKWFDVDFPEVITQRRKHYGPIPGYTMLGADVRERKWLDTLPDNQRAIVVMEGISMYLQTGELVSLLSSLHKRFGTVHLLMDCYTSFAAKASKYKNPVNAVGVTTVYGIDDPATLQISGLRYVSEHEITPGYLVNELTSFEKSFFNAMFTGQIAGRLYRLYEFEGS